MKKWWQYLAVFTFLYLLVNDPDTATRLVTGLFGLVVEVIRGAADVTQGVT